MCAWFCKNRREVLFLYRIIQSPLRSNLGSILHILLETSAVIRAPQYDIMIVKSTRTRYDFKPRLALPQSPTPDPRPISPETCALSKHP